MLTAAVSLLLLGGVFTIGDFVSSITRQIEDRVEVSVFLDDEITPEQQSDISKQLNDLPVVRKVSYVTKEEAYEEFKDLYRDQPVLYENIGPDVLPASFRVEMKDPKRVDVVKSKLEGNPAVEEVNDQRETVQRIVDFTRLLRTFSAVLVAILFGAAVLLIANAIQLAIYARRTEIEIMKLVGATNWFVRIPFMMEGIFAGVGGALVALGFLTAGKALVRPRIPTFIPTAALHGVDPVQVAWLVLLGTSIGAIGSAVAMRRFLDT
jgi:cell division transport system permease protein